MDSGLLQLRDHVVNLCRFEERSIIGQSDRVLNQIYQRADDQFLFVVKSISLTECIEKLQIEKEIENLINLVHPCIAAPIGFVYPMESVCWQELKIIRLHLDGCSLSEVISVSPEWWTATAKAKAVAGIVLGLRFAHSLGLLHGHLNSSNILFDVDHHIQMTDFSSIRLEVSDNDIGGFSGVGWTPKIDIRAFASILFEIVVGRPANDQPFVPTYISMFVSEIIKAGLWFECESPGSFCDIFEILLQNYFRIMDGVDSTEVLAFVNWVESVEHLDQYIESPHLSNLHQRLIKSWRLAFDWDGSATSELAPGQFMK
jgi:hypothetical protein